MPTIDLPTLFLLTTALLVLMGVMFLVTWAQDRRGNLAMMHWGVAHLLAVPGCVLLGLRGQIPDWASIGAANLLILLAFGQLVVGAHAFEGRRAHPLVGFGGALAWLIATQIPLVWEVFAHRVAFVSFTIACHAAVTARLFHLGQRQEPLPSRRIAVGLLGLIGLTHAVRIGLTLFGPAGDGSYATLGSGWVAFVAVQMVLQTVLLGFVLVSMVKERAEDRQRRAAEIDGLTGVLTRRAFRDRAAARLEADASRGALLIFDLDRFKTINDTHGHLAGDRVLAAFAGVVSRRIGTDDVFGRYGGEEFALFLATADVGAAWRLADGIRRDFAELDLVHDGRAIEATVSVGVAAVPMIEPELDRLVACADAGLYAAKQAGRDRVEAGSGVAPDRRLPSRRPA